MTVIQHIKLSELTKKVEEVIKKAFGPELYWILAEISSHKFYPNQDRHYLEFIEKDEHSSEPIAKVRGVSWRSGSLNIRIFESNTGQVFTNGLQVLVKVKVEFHPTYGFSLVLQDIDQSFTLGNIERQRRETLIKLVNENPDAIQLIGEEYVTKNKKIKLRAVIQNIAIVGSPNSEGYTDFVHTIRNNQFKYKYAIDIYQSSVQGGEAEKELINKLILIYQSAKQYDCVVIIRGGGSKSDFIVFDTYSLSRAVARFPIPIITGIGHHEDVSIVDLMVNTTTKTPTKAAEFIVSHNRSFEESIITFQKSIIIKSQQLLGNSLRRINAANVIIINQSRTLISRYKDNLAQFNQIVVNRTKTIFYNRQTNLVSLLNQILSRPRIITANKTSELSNLLNNLTVFVNKYLTNQRGYLGNYNLVVNLMSPKSILKKGFAIVSQDGKIVKNAERIALRSELRITMEDYYVNSKVISKSKNDGTEFDL